jgi:hypothetical protein
MIPLFVEPRLRKASLKILGRSRPRKLVIASTAPQIRYPDCYGIDMSELGKFIAFQAAISLIQDHGYRGVLLKEVAQSSAGRLWPNLPPNRSTM